MNGECSTEVTGDGEVTGLVTEYCAEVTGLVIEDCVSTQGAMQSR